MTKLSQRQSVFPCLPRGLAVYGEAELKAREEILGCIRTVYERYGFEPVETPIIEYAVMLGDFLPDQDRPHAGRFQFDDDDGQCLSLRYDLTAPLARYVAEHFDTLPKPYRSYRVGYVFRNEKPGPGRFRQFMQFDADTVGASGIAADAEMCMMAADCMAALGLQCGEYLIRVNNRKLLDGLLEIIGLGRQGCERSYLTVLRAIDKLDRLGSEAVAFLLGKGRVDDSGDFTKGAELSSGQVDTIMSFVNLATDKIETSSLLSELKYMTGESRTGLEAVAELEELFTLTLAGGFGDDRVKLDPSVVRGLEYYTASVFEAALFLPPEAGAPTRACSGSVGGGGRYDGLVGRFRTDNVPATGFSIGISRLQAALAGQRFVASQERDGPVVVLVMDQDRIPDYQRMVQRLRSSGIQAEMYLGSGGMRTQMKYADRRKSPLAIIQGTDEFFEGSVTIKDLEEGTRLAQFVSDNREWRESRPAQVKIPETQLVDEVRKYLTARGKPVF